MMAMVLLMAAVMDDMNNEQWDKDEKSGTQTNYICSPFFVLVEADGCITLNV